MQSSGREALAMPVPASRSKTFTGQLSAHRAHERQPTSAIWIRATVYLLASRTTMPPRLTTTSIFVSPNRWVAHDKHGS
jgi:hypothetical protein